MELLLLITKSAKSAESGPIPIQTRKPTTTTPLPKDYDVPESDIDVIGKNTFKTWQIHVFSISATTASSLGDDDLLGTTPQSDYDYEEPTPEPESGTSGMMISLILMIIELVFLFWKNK